MDNNNLVKFDEIIGRVLEKLSESEIGTEQYEAYAYELNELMKAYKILSDDEKSRIDHSIEMIKTRDSSVRDVIHMIIDLCKWTGGAGLVLYVFFQILIYEETGIVKSKIARNVIDLATKLWKII